MRPDGRLHVERDRGTLQVVMRYAAALLVVLVLAACGPGNTTPANVTPDPASATTIQGRFALAFAIERATVRPGDEVKGKATLSLLSPGGATISGSSTVIAFEFTQVGGEGRHVVPVRPGDCAPSRVTSNVQMVAPITKSGAVVDGPDADWYRAFFNDPVLHLTKGEWDVTADAAFFDGEDCRGQPIELRTTVRVHVIE